MSFLKKIKKPFKKPGKAIRGVVHDVKDAADDVAHGKLPDVDHFADEVKDVVDDAADEVKKLVEAALKEALSAAQSGVLRKVVSVMEAAVPTGIEFSLGPIGMQIDDAYEKIEAIKGWAKNPPDNHHDLRLMLTRLAPTSVSVTLSVSLAFLVVQSDSLALGCKLSWGRDEFLERFDSIMGSL